MHYIIFYAIQNVKLCENAFFDILLYLFSMFIAVRNLLGPCETRLNIFCILYNLVKSNGSNKHPIHLLREVHFLFIYIFFVHLKYPKVHLTNVDFGNKRNIFLLGGRQRNIYLFSFFFSFSNHLYCVLYFFILLL